MRAYLLSAIMMVMAVGCSGGPEQVGEDEAGFTLIQNDGTTFEATYSSGGASVRALLVESTSNVVEVTYDFGDPVIGFHIDYNKGEGSFMPSGKPLDAAQSRLITLLLEGISNVVPQLDTERTRVQDAAVRQTSFMQIVPVGERLSSFQYVSERGWVHISCSCANKHIGSGYYRTAGMGCSCTGGSGNGCKGRCGQGCGGTSTPKCVGTTAYTQDCAKHDYGLGSWAAASDDYSFASNNCNCSGSTCY
jgi:hypothetical protein